MNSPGQPTAIDRPSLVFYALAAYLILAFIYRTCAPAHEYLLRWEWWTMALSDLAVCGGLIALRAKGPAWLFWVGLAAGAGLFLIYFNGNASRWTGHLMYSIPPR